MRYFALAVMVIAATAGLSTDAKFRHLSVDHRFVAVGVAAVIAAAILGALTRSRHREAAPRSGFVRAHRQDR
jgi:hypothetical protein